MRHLVFSALALAQARSAAEAVRRGTGGPRDTTKFWWGVEPYADGRAAVVVGVDTTGLTAAETLSLVDAPAVGPEE